MPKSHKPAPKPKRSKQARSLAELPSQPDPRAPFELKLFLRATAPVLRRLEADLLTRAHDSPSVGERLEGEHKRQVAAQRTADAYPQWLQAFVEQVAAAWVLACVFVRTLEDRALLKQNRLAGPGASDSLREFLSLAPSLSERDYIELCLRELLHQPAAEALFGPQNPLWLLAPSAEGARALLELFRMPNAEAPALRFGQADTRFLGDLYQDLNEHVRERYALLQTPKFVEDYILDRTLEPAIERFGLDHATLIDPTCGSGHFLLGAFDRLFERHQRAAPNELETVIGERALAQVYGVDINPYAVAITRFRLTLALLERAGLDRLSKAPKLTLNVVVADSLLHSPRVDALAEKAGNGEVERRWFSLEDEQAARALLNPQTKFAAVVGNPPYITVKDDALRELYRKAYVSAAGKYSAAVVFTERFFELARAEGRVGMITANSFMKREFGKKLITEFLPTVDLDFVVNSAGAYIPGHGTPTVLLFGTQRPPRGKSVLSVLGKRGEPTTPDDASQGLVWSSIRDHGERVGYEDDYISVAKISREKLGEHPWSLAGGGAEDLKALLEERAEKRLGEVVSSIGFMAIMGEDECFVADPAVFERHRLVHRIFGIGEYLRDWGFNAVEHALFPYDDRWTPSETTATSRWLWPYKVLLSKRLMFGKTQLEAGLRWFEYRHVGREKVATPLSIAFAFVATHNHFVLDRGGKVFKQTAPIIKLPEGATEDDHLALLAYLNSSTACFYLKQVCQSKGLGGQGGGIKPEEWHRQSEFDSTKVGSLPVPQNWNSLAEISRRMTRLAEDRREHHPDAVVQRWEANGGDLDLALRGSKEAFERLTHEMVRVQEEVDWSVYRLFGIFQIAEIPQAMRMRPEERACERRFADLIRERGEETNWYNVHERGPAEDEPRPLEKNRLNAIAESRHLALLESVDHKRRWEPLRFDAVKVAALSRSVERRFEMCFRQGTLKGQEMLTRSRSALQEVAASLELDEPASWSVTRLSQTAVPFLAAYRFSGEGITKFRQWQATWALQRREDAGEKIRSIPVPPKYDQKDFRKPEYWRLRGKLDVPKERFISYPGLESDEDHEPLYGWAGWDHAQRARALVEVYQARKDEEGWSSERLTPALAGLHELLPWVQQWHNEPDAAYDGARFGDDLAAFLGEELRNHGLTEAQLLAWRPEGGAKKSVRKVASRSVASSKVPAKLRKAEPDNDNLRAKPRKKRAEG